MKSLRALRILVGTAVFVTSASPFVALAATPSTPICPYSWSRPLTVGATGPDVLKLQQFLNTNASTSIAKSGDGSPGHETGRFGGLTKMAVAKFQEKYADDILTPNGLTKGSGMVGLSTRTKLNALCFSITGTPPKPTILGAATTTVALAPALIISAATQPATTLAPKNALYVPFTNVTLTAQGADVIVHSVTVERVGPAQDQAFADVDLFDTDDNFYVYSYFNANHQTVLKKDIAIPSGTSLTLSIRGDMAADLTNYDGQMAGLSVVAIDASAPIQGTLPARGTFQTINNSLTIGAPQITLSPFDPMAERTRYINDTGITFAGVRVTADSAEDEKITDIAWRQVGSASASDLTNVVVIVDGQSYPTNLEGRNYSATLGDGIKLSKGNSLDVEIKGDLTSSGSNRTVQFNINDGSDIGIKGATYGYNLFPVPSDHTDTLDSGNHSVFATTDGTTGGTSLKPYFVGSITNISGAAMVSIGR